MSLQEIKDRPIQIAVLTISDSRTIANDRGGHRVSTMLREDGHELAVHEMVKDDKRQIASMIRKWIKNENIDVIICTGGTGIAPRDVTIEAIQPLLEKDIPGFGELFRYLSFTVDIGTKAMASRAIAGTVGTKLIFAIPGSIGACTLAMSKLILPEIPHLVHELHRNR